VIGGYRESEDRHVGSGWSTSENEVYRPALLAMTALCSNEQPGALLCAPTMRRPYDRAHATHPYPALSSNGRACAARPYFAVIGVHRRLSSVPLRSSERGAAPSAVLFRDWRARKKHRRRRRWMAFPKPLPPKGGRFYCD
jgi:hypothetical protein